MQRFFVEPYQVLEEEHRITLTGPDLNHMKNVLRMRIGEEVWISDGSEKEYHCTIEEFQEDSAVLHILYAQESQYELPSRIYLFQGLPKGDKMELIIQKAVEHAAVGQPAERLEQMGYEVTIVPVDHRGVVQLEALEKALRPDTILVSTMYVNNEVGAVMPVEEIAKLVHEKSPKALYHVDAIQAFGKYRIYPKKAGIDMLSVSSHKIHGPKGVGFLYINEKARIQPQILGGGQQAGMRSGTDNVPGIAGLGVAAKMVYTDFDKKIEHMYQLKERLAEGFLKLPDVRLNGMEIREGAPQILSASFLGVRSEVLLHTLEEKGIYVSAGSACSSHKRKAAGTLSAMGMEAAQRESTLRFSFSEENTFEEVDYALEVIGQVLPMLRRYSRH